MQKLGELINNEIKILVEKELNSKTLTEEKSYIATDSFGEVIEKLVILHIRTWMLEDMIGESKNVNDIAEYTKKLEICFKVKRPKLVEAINLLINDAIINNKSLLEDSVKIYKGT